MVDEKLPRVVEIALATYNQLPAFCRKTVEGIRFAMVDGEWRPVRLTKEPKHE
jgi:hypothetical protein